MIVGNRLADAGLRREDSEREILRAIALEQRLCDSSICRRRSVLGRRLLLVRDD